MNKLYYALMIFFIIQSRLFAQMQCPGGQPYDDCESIGCLSCDLNGEMGSTAGYGKDPDNDLQPLFCGTVSSVQFYQFIAAVPDMFITVTMNNCVGLTDVDLGLMDTCDDTLVACQAGNGSNSTTLKLTGLTVGDPYILIVNVQAAAAEHQPAGVLKLLHQTKIMGGDHDGGARPL